MREKQDQKDGNSNKSEEDNQSTAGTDQGGIGSVSDIWKSASYHFTERKISELLWPW